MAEIEKAARADGEDVKDQIEQRAHEFDREMVEFN